MLMCLSCIPAIREDNLPKVATGLAVTCDDATVVTKRVFASPIHTLINLDRPGSRVPQNESKPCYPEVCFAVENFEDAFSDLVSC